MRRLAIACALSLAACTGGGGSVGSGDADGATDGAVLDAPQDTEASDSGTDTTASPDVAEPDVAEPDAPVLDVPTSDGPVDGAGDTAGSSDVTLETTETPDALPDVTTDGWPINPDKDQIPDPGWESVPQTGSVMPNFTAIDQYGNEIQLYDLAMEGKPIILDVGTWFCEPCKSLAWYLSTGSTGECPYADTILGELGWWNEDYEITKALVDEGVIRWVTVLYSLGTPVTPQDAAAWHEAFPHDEIVVMADSTLQLQEYLNVGAMPHIDVLDENMVFLVYDVAGPKNGMKKIVELYGD